jgi:AAA domain
VSTVYTMPRVDFGEGTETRHRPAFQVLDDVEIMSRPDPPAIVAGRIFTDTNTFAFGPPESLKSFVFAVDLACSIAANVQWLDAEIVTPGPVVVIVAEGAAQFKKRIKAWKLAHHFPLDQCIGIYIVPQPVYLMDRASTRGFCDDVLLRLKPVLTIGDTWARCMAGADENSAQDAGEGIGALDMWRRETGTANLWIMHTRADEKRERGSSALRGAADTMISMLPTDDVVSMRCDKQKDAEEFAPLLLKKVLVPDADSCVVRLASEVLPSGELTDSQRQVLEALWENFGGDGATAAEWMKTLPGVAERTFYRSKKVLADRLYVEPKGQRIYRRRHP